MIIDATSYSTVTANFSLAYQCFPLHTLSERESLWSGLSLLDEGALDSDCAALPQQVAQDLANCLPFLACGEESAVHAFSYSLLKHIRAADLEEMQLIAKDELRHAHYLDQLKRKLPLPDIVLPAEAMTDFFKRLLTRDPARHFAQVAALDLSVCRLLTRLLQPQACLYKVQEIAELLRRIVRDEARHVKVARQMASELGLSSLVQKQIDSDIEQRLARLLLPIKDNLDRLSSTSLTVASNGNTRDDATTKKSPGYL